ncbi:MAG: DUF928 domain-containing protein [Kovacikia sp.]
MKRVLRSTMAGIMVALTLVYSGSLALAIDHASAQNKGFKSWGGPPPKTIRIGAPPRGSCFAETSNPTSEPPALKPKLLVALAPEIDFIDKSGTPVKAPSGQTSLEHPTLWFYVPYTRSDVLTVKPEAVELTLYVDKGDKTTSYTTRVTLPETPGIIGVQIPPDFPALKIDQWYSWSFEVKCNDPTDSDRADQVAGLIQRVDIDPAVKKQIETANPQQRVELYTENGIWFDALTALGELRRAQPIDQTLMNTWVSLLSEADLKNIAGQPIAR